MNLVVMKENIRRLGTWWVLSLISLVAVLVMAPQQAQVLVYKLCLVAFSVLMAYWTDRALFRFAPPISSEMPRDTVSAARLIARAIVALAIIVGLTLGI